MVTVVQRFRSDLGLYVHLHCLVTDGAYAEQNDGELRFLAAPPPTPERMTAVLAQVHEVVRAADDDLDIDPALAACVQLSLAGPQLGPGSQSAAPPPMTLSAFGISTQRPPPTVATASSSSESAATSCARPSPSGAITALPGDRVRVSFKAPWRSGTAHADMDARRFLAHVLAQTDAAAPPTPNMDAHQLLTLVHRRA